MTQRYQFKEYASSLIAETLNPDNMKRDEAKSYGRENCINKEYTNNMTVVSSYYIYTGTPPHGYGTQAPKVAETVKRAYNYNKKQNNKRMKIADMDVERLHWEKADGDFPWDSIHGNYIPSELRAMTERYLQRYRVQIDSTVERVMNHMLHSNSDVLTKGRQTFCPFTNQSVTASVAYKRFHEFLEDNLGDIGPSCLEWVMGLIQLFEKDKITYLTTKLETVVKKTYDKRTNQRRIVQKEIKRITKAQTNSVEETRKIMFNLIRRFDSYIKHKERGKKERRAIASAGMGLRMFLNIIEEFHLALSKDTEGATISIGGEEKKAKITSNFSDDTILHQPAAYATQGTEDASKWNECLAPSAFATMHYYFFNSATRTKLGLPQPTEMGKLFSQIAIMGNFFMAVKQIRLGQGVQVRNENHYSRISWNPANRDHMNSFTRSWFDEIEQYLDGDHEFLNASPGMLMGMLNAGSTTLGLLPVNHRMWPDKMRVVTLRSSDDSMSMFLSTTKQYNKECILRDKRNREMVGINTSAEKTLIMVRGRGEYTSWYMDKKFVAQYGVETASIRPQGKSPHDDFSSLAKSTAAALSTLTINPLGATIRLKLGIDGIRRLWKIHHEPGKRGTVSSKVQLLSDGGDNPWNCMNCSLDEISYKETFCSTDEDKEYLLTILNPSNPFSSEPSQALTFSKETGTMVLETIDTPRNIFCYTKRTNRTIRTEAKEKQAELEKCYGEASEIIKSVDPSTLIITPRTGTRISDHLVAILRVQADKFQLNQDEVLLFSQAMNILRNGPAEAQIDSDDEPDDDL